MQPPVYDAPPLVEALFELFVVDARWSKKSAQKLARAFAAKRFSGEQDDVRQLGLQVQFGPGNVIAPMATVHPGGVRKRCWTPEKDALVQFGADMCSYNVIARYARFEQHAPDVSEFFQAYLQEAEPEKIAWAGQRYINRIVLPSVDESLSRYLTVYPTLPEALRHPPFSMQFVAGAFTGGSVVINLTNQGTEGAFPVYMMDLYARSETELPLDIKAIVEWHSHAHVAIRKAFESSITEQARQLFKRRTS